jgi:AhpC/TSA family
MATLSIALLMQLLAAVPPEVAHPLPSGSRIGSFAVLATDGTWVKASASEGQLVVVGFISTRCPISNAFNFRMNELYKDFGSRVKFLFVDSNVNEGMDEIREHARQMGYEFPVYKDVDNAVADMLGAETIPEAFVINSGTIRYRGNIEDSPNPERAKSRSLRSALEEVLSGRPVSVPETRVRGCAIRRNKALIQ